MNAQPYLLGICVDTCSLCPPSDILSLDHSITTISNAASALLVEPSSLRSDINFVFYASEAVEFRYLTQNTFSEVQRMIRTMGKVIGWKKCVLLIDTLIAELYDTFLDRARLYGLTHDKNHGDWISSKCGIMVAVNEVSPCFKYSMRTSFYVSFSP